MNEYEELAAEYFECFEGSKHYPSLWGWHWYVWLMTFALFATAVRGVCVDQTERVMSLPLLWMLGTEMVFLVVCFAIGRHKHRSVLTTCPLGPYKEAERLANGKRQALERLCSIPPTQFGDFATRCSELEALQRKYRSGTDLDAQEMLRQLMSREVV
jgi:hypothetical protein